MEVQEKKFQRFFFYGKQKVFEEINHIVVIKLSSVKYLVLIEPWNKNLLSFPSLILLKFSIKFFKVFKYAEKLTRKKN